jgi:hypothetical protein
MRFMMLVIPNGYANATPGTTPPADLVEKMSKFNDALRKAGVLLALDGLHPPSAGVRVKFEKGKASATDGPFAEAKETVGGFWMIQVKDKAEAVAWASRAPMLDGDMIEIRQVQEMADFPPEVQKVAR